MAAAVELTVAKRYLTATATERNAVIYVAAAIGAGFIALILFMYFTTRGAPPEVLLLTAPGVAMLGGAAYFWLKKREWVTVDLAARKATFVAPGKPEWTASLDEVAPVAIVKAQREMYSNGRPYWRTEYRVVMAGAGRGVTLRSTLSYRQTRRAADALAREWKVALSPLDGRIRAFSELDQSLAAARSLAFDPRREAPALGADTGVTLEERPEQTILRSSKSLSGSEVPNYLWLVGAGMAGLAASERNALAVLADPLFDPLDTALVAVLLIALFATLGTFLYQAWRALLPAEVGIDANRVHYRGRSVPTAQVVEVVSADAICVCTPRATLEIPHGFCEAQSTPQVIDALRRVIADKGQPRTAVR